MSRRLGRAGVAVGLVLALAVGYTVGKGEAPPPAKAGAGAEAARAKPPDSIKKKLKAMNGLMDLLRDRIANGETEEAKRLLIEIEQLKKDLVRDLDQTWPGVSPWIQDLLWIDRDLGQVSLGLGSGFGKDALLGLLELAKIMKEGMEKEARSFAGKPFRPFRVALTASADHEPPQSDVCVAIKTKPAQAGATALTTLQGEGQDAVAGASAQRLKLDARGRVQARFLVNKVGGFQFDVVVVSKRGHSLLESLALSNAEPSGTPCNG